MPKQIRWHETPEQHNYPAAESYLSLTMTNKNARKLIKKLHRSKMTRFKAKDIFRSSGLSLLGVSNSHVEENNRKIKLGKKISPLLLVRNGEWKVIIADGYHRLCAVYQFHEDAWIPCKII